MTRASHFWRLWVFSTYLPWTTALRSSYEALTACAYSELAEAEVQKTFWGNVEVKYCGTSITLTKSSAQPSAWNTVNWRDPKLQNTSLTEEDLKTFQEHLGSYEYSMAVGMLGRGLVPTRPENYEWSWNETDPVKLVQAVLNFEVRLARALNKLPDSTSETHFWRGAWLPPEALKSLTVGSTVSFPWFQSSTTDKIHSYTFIHSKWQPQFCAPSCEKRGCGCLQELCMNTMSKRIPLIPEGYAFPVQFQIQSCHAKDMRTWNAVESEFILLPNLRFEVVNVTKIANDPVWESTSKETEAWLRSTHELPDWYRRQQMIQDPKVLGPWPKVADVVRDWHMNGPAFVVWYNVRFSNPANEMWQQMNMTFKEQYDLHQMMKSRFRLASLQSFARLEPNSVRFFNRVEMRDVLPC